MSAKAHPRIRPPALKRGKEKAGTEPGFQARVEQSYA
jgi:hypothetical protein